MFFSGPLALLCLALANTVRAEIDLRVTSYNIRYDASDREANELKWEDRRPLLVQQIKDLAANVDVNQPETAIVGLQEVLDGQLGDIHTDLGRDKWNFIGVGRKNGGKEGEYNPIFYNTDVLELVYQTTRWLSLTPDVAGSQSWGSGSDRIVTIGVFKHKTTLEQFISANTHLDNVSDEARTEQIKVAVAEIEKVHAAYVGTGKLGITLTGDFNSDPSGAAYTTLANLNYLTDSFNTAPKVGDNQLTYTGFTDNGISKIDFVWYGANADNLFTPTKTEILTNKVDGWYTSDHRAIYADFVLYPSAVAKP